MATKLDDLSLKDTDVATAFLFTGAVKLNFNIGEVLIPLYVNPEKAPFTFKELKLNEGGGGITGLVLSLLLFLQAASKNKSKKSIKWIFFILIVLKPKTQSCLT
jgi:hypothetical protein